MLMSKEKFIITFSFALRFLCVFKSRPGSLAEKFLVSFAKSIHVHN